MTATLIDGRAAAANVRAAVKNEVDVLRARGIHPSLAVVVVGDDPASQVYVRNKTRACEETGIRSVTHRLAADVDERTLLARIDELNADVSVHGVLVQLPLPAHLDAQRILHAVVPGKDVDGFHPHNLGALLEGRPAVVPCTPAGVMHLLHVTGVPLAGKRAVVIGRSVIVGKPLALLLLQKDATVTMCHSRSGDLAVITREADVLIAAAGRERLVDASMVRPGACVIDVGINRSADGRLVGDVDFDAVRAVAGLLTPVPGGVGPMTVAMLLRNCLAAAARSA